MKKVLIIFLLAGFILAAAPCLAQDGSDFTGYIGLPKADLIKKEGEPTRVIDTGNCETLVYETKTSKKKITTWVGVCGGDVSSINEVEEEWIATQP